MNNNNNNENNDDDDERRRRIAFANLVKAALDCRLRVSGRVHTGSARPEFVGTAFPVRDGDDSNNNNNNGGHMGLEITSRGRFTARVDGLSNDEVRLTIDGVEVPCDVSDASAFGADGVRVHLNADSDDHAWFWLELYAPASPAVIAVIAVAPPPQTRRRSARVLARRGAAA